LGVRGSAVDQYAVIKGQRARQKRKGSLAKAPDDSLKKRKWSKTSESPRL